MFSREHFKSLKGQKNVHSIALSLRDLVDRISTATGSDSARDAFLLSNLRK